MIGRVVRGVEMRSAVGDVLFEFWTSQAALPTSWYEAVLGRFHYRLELCASYCAGYGPMRAFKFRAVATTHNS